MIKKHTEVREKTVERSEIEVIDGYYCDFCLKKAPSWDGDWDTGYDDDKITIKRQCGVNYPEGGSSTTESYHVCPACWKDKIQALFPTPPTTEMRDW